MEFAIIENNEIKEIRSLPNWFFSTDTKYGKAGDLVTKEYLIEVEGWYEVIDNYPQNINSDLQIVTLNDKKYWEINHLEKKVIKSYNIVDKDINQVINEYKQNFLNQLKILFEQKSTKGFLFIEALNITVDSDRTSLQNIDSLLYFMQENNLQTITFRLYDNSFTTLTYSELLLIKNEIINFGINLYNWKWQKEQEILSLQTYDECKNYKLE